MSKDNPNARVVDKYDLFENNCTTKTTESIKEGSGGAVNLQDAPYVSPASYNDGRIITPVKLDAILQNRVTEKGSGIKEVKYTEINKELNLPNGAGNTW